MKAIWNGEVIAESNDTKIVEVNGKINQDAAWFYPEPSGLADGIKDRVAFWKGVEVTR